MIEARDFVERARDFGYHRYAGVPCSFLTPFIDYAIADDNLVYVSSANEGDAVAICAGAFLGGQRPIAMMQNSGLGNAVNPLVSLAHAFRIPMLLIVTLRGDPELNDEPQHQLMGEMTGGVLDAMRIPWEYFPTDAGRIEETLRRAESHMSDMMRPYALVMRKDSVARSDSTQRHKLRYDRDQKARIGGAHTLTARLSRAKVLQRVVEMTAQPNTVVIATTGYTGRELYALSDRPNHLYMVGSMGCASSLGMGLAMTRPDLRVVVLDGEGAALMRMGNFATLGAYGGGNLVHILLDNEAHDSTGAQATVSNNVSFAGIARACGYPIALEDDNLSILDHLLGGTGRIGPRFGCLKIRTGTLEVLPRPTLSPAEVRARFMAHIGAPSTPSTGPA
ncbi:MAG: phosphonopyruvate decarboxylase [Gammaproteobacteria bacterium]